MLIQKVTTGFVVQTFDTEKRKFVSQDFFAGDEVEYEMEDGEPISSSLLEVDGKEAYLSFDMVQPGNDGEVPPNIIQLKPITSKLKGN